jgi:hypothetical protein
MQWQADAGRHLFPLERLPNFLQTLHRILLVMYMTDLIR